MKGYLFMAVMMVLLVGLLAGCGAPGAAAEVDQAAAASKVVESFFQAELAYEGNSLVDKSYRESPYLAASYVEAVDEMIASFDPRGGGGSPFFCAQDRPGELGFEEAKVEGDQAEATVHEVWNPGTEFELIHDLTVSLELAEGGWLIMGIACPQP